MLDAVTLGQAPGTTSTAMGLGGLDGQAFLKLMIAQMRYQDPLAPTDASALMNQTSTLAQTEMIQQLAATQQQVLGLQFAGIASGLLGTDITAQLPDGGTITGTVDAVRFTGSGPVLLVDGQEVPLGAATELRSAD
jgi:flagellar basal-body rod modification protein FlgD